MAPRRDLYSSIMITKLPADWLAESRVGPRTVRKPVRRNRVGAAASEPLLEAIRRSQQALLQMQDSEGGYWCGAIFGDSTIDADTIMLLNFLGQGGSPKIQRIGRHILTTQGADGGWPIYSHGPSDISATVKAYWALKFAGWDSDAPPLVAARACIRKLGGIHKVNTYTKFYLAIFGQYDWRGVPMIPPEIMLLPNWFYFNLYQMSSWTRAIVVPLAIVRAHLPAMACPQHATLDELFPDSRRHVPLADAVGPSNRVSWRNFFLLLDAALRTVEAKGGARVRDGKLRTQALKLAEEWMLQRLQDSDGLGAIYPAILNTILAMKCLGYADDDPRLVEQLGEIERLEVSHEASTRYQPTLSPVWDTALSMIALAESGIERRHEALARACDWILSKEIKIRGDWAVTNANGPTGGWHFQFRNAFNADVDDTAMVLLALRHVKLDEPQAALRKSAFLRGLNWVLSMQGPSGGWAAFDRDNTRTVLTEIPFADHNAMIDPPTADVTARVLEVLGYLGLGVQDAPVAKALEFLRNQQEPDGSWFGRWGVNYLYGTWQVLRGLAAIGEDPRKPHMQRAVRWLTSVQLPDGGWGETCATYEDPRMKGQGPATPTQTAWALMGLMAAGVVDDAVHRGIGALVRTQRSDGTWDESQFTGTGFPKVYYLEYTMYRNYFPLQALGIYRRTLQNSGGATP